MEHVAGETGSVCDLIVLDCWVAAPSQGRTSVPQTDPIVPQGEKHWNVVSIRATSAGVNVRPEPPPLSKSVVLLPVANARSSLRVELPSSPSVSDSFAGFFKLAACKKR